MIGVMRCVGLMSKFDWDFCYYILARRECRLYLFLFLFGFFLTSCIVPVFGFFIFCCLCFWYKIECNCVSVMNFVCVSVQLDVFCLCCFVFWF